MGNVRIVMRPEGFAKIGAAVDRTVGRLVEDIADDARRFVPVDTGATRDGIEATGAVNGRARVNVTRLVPGDDPEVPKFIEFGTEDTPAQPFMRPALYRRRTL